MRENDRGTLYWKKTKDNMKTQHGLAINRADNDDGGFSVVLFRPGGELFGSIDFRESLNEWRWGQETTPKLAEAIVWADEDFVEQQDERKEKRDALEPHWQAVVDEYGGEN